MSELRKSIILALRDSNNLHDPMSPDWEINYEKMNDAIIDAVIAALPEDKHDDDPDLFTIKGYNFALKDVRAILNLAKEQTK